MLRNTQCEGFLSGFLTIFTARTRHAFWERRPGFILLGASILALAVTTLLGHYGRSMLGIGSLDLRVVGYIWCYVIIGFLIQDLVIKRSVYACIDHLNMTSIKEQAFEERARRATLSCSLLEPSSHRGGRESLRSSSLLLPPALVVNSVHQAASLEARLLSVERYVQELEATIQKLKNQMKGGEEEDDDEGEGKADKHHVGQRRRMMMMMTPPPPAGSPLRRHHQHQEHDAALPGEPAASAVGPGDTESPNRMEKGGEKKKNMTATAGAPAAATLPPPSMTS